MVMVHRREFGYWQFGDVMLPKPYVATAIAEHLAAFPSGPDGLVFRARRGGPIRRTDWRHRVWLPALRHAGIAEPWPRVHDLRQTAASLAVLAGAHPKAVAEMLGHSTVTLTLDRYGHLFPSLVELLAERLDATFREARPASLDAARRAGRAALT
jgi:integrase